VTEIPQAAAVGRVLGLATALTDGVRGARLAEQLSTIWKGADQFLISEQH
jgi:hypothetical protein